MANGTVSRRYLGTRRTSAAKPVPPTQEAYERGCKGVCVMVAAMMLVVIASEIAKAVI